MLQSEVEKVYVDDNILMYITERALALLKLSRAHALVSGRNYVIPDDVKFMAVDALAHRVILHIERIMEGRLATAVIRSIVTKTEVPKSFTRENAGGLL